MTLQQLLYVIEIDKQGSFNAAATALYASQPTISVAIRDLEEEIGYKIFLRTNRGIKLTNRGVEFIHYAKKVIYEYDQLNEACLEYSKKDKIKFRVSSQHYGFLSEAFIIFFNSHNYDTYNFVMKETKSLEAIEDVFQKRSNIAIIAVTENNRTILEDIFEKKGIVFNHLSYPKPHVFVRKDHPLTKKDKIKVEDLSDFPALLYEQDGNDLLSEELVIQRKLNKVMYINDRATLIGIIGNSDAYNIGTGYLSDEMKNANMIAIPIESKHATSQELGWIHLEKYEPSIEAYQFIEIIRKLLNKNKVSRKAIVLE
ncbi:DNA-binding transcriptional LysR family regulator [Bacilli bacterium PM5-9]|nr:DNA-binding transcriptional LysR family regulator [Bacilli bacterium PM5-9]